MKKKYYMPSTDPELKAWLVNFSAKIATYATKYNLSAAEVTLIQNAAAYLIYWIDVAVSIKATVQAINGFKNQVRNGVPAGGSPGVTPPDITFTPPTAVAPGVVVFMRSIVARIKAHQTYSTTDGEDLKIEGAENDVDIATLKPVFTIEMVNGQPNLKWTKGICQGVIIKVTRVLGGPGPTPTPTPTPTPSPASSEFTFLAIDTMPDYLDTYPLPPFGQSANWAYVMKYIINDEEVGLWSDPVIVTVVGHF